MSTVTVELPPATLTQVQAEARQDDDTVGEWIARAVAEKLMRRQSVDARVVRAILCRACNRRRKHYARQLCRPCYDRLARDPSVRWARTDRRRRKGTAA